MIGVVRPSRCEDIHGMNDDESRNFARECMDDLEARQEAIVELALFDYAIDSERASSPIPLTTRSSSRPGDELVAVEAPPAFLGGLQQLVGHPERGGL